ncbi:hypothetical protein [Parachitinimonas caeni]|uniref:Uncharacterized protein n=1 Tax=Parachitinimonas caeni TaxID=3031301 RepID=A0ABT7E307_9NEIS|nr:hypothetical protein [Parachitinimonas caeni]MDK2126701.1 hypothetical protein [Parachitinimonas caeni]
MKLTTEQQDLVTFDLVVFPEMGITYIDDKESDRIHFARYLLEGGEPSYTVTFFYRSQVVAKFKNLDTDTLADTVGDKNALKIAGSDNGILHGNALHNEYGLSSEEVDRRILAKEERKEREFKSTLVGSAQT